MLHSCSNLSCRRWAVNYPLFWACLKHPISGSQRGEVSKLLVYVVPGLLFNRSLPLAKLFAHSEIPCMWHSCQSQDFHSPVPSPPHPPPSSLHSRRCWQVVLPVLHPRQPVGSLGSSSLWRQARWVPRRPGRQVSSSPPFWQIVISKRPFRSMFLITCSWCDSHPL